MVTIGNDTLPGPITTLDSAPSAGANVGAPAIPVIMGQAYLDEGNASAATMKRISRPKTAVDEFGPADKSQLTTAVMDAIVAGAYPVYAVAPGQTDVTGEDLSGKSGSTGTLQNAPVVEHAADITFTVNSTTKDTVLYYDGDPVNASVGTDEVYLNPQTGKYKVDESQGNSGDDVEYSYVDYTEAFKEVSDAKVADIQVREVVDFVGVTDERQGVVDSLKSKVIEMQNNGNYVIGVAGAGKPYIDDSATSTDEIDNYSNPYDTSRMQLITPSRKDDHKTVIGAYLGKRSDIGISNTPIFKFLTSITGLQKNLSRAKQEKLVSSRVIPLEERNAGAKIKEDLTTVSDGNSEEEAWKQGISRLVTDFVAETVEEESNDFIGEFNDQTTLNNVRSAVAQNLKDLLNSRSIEAYSLVVEEVDSMTAAVDIGIDTADPLRNIELNITAGAVSNGVQVN